MSSEEQQPKPPQQADQVWDALKLIYQNCAAYTIVPAALGPLLRNAELVAKVSDQNALLNHSRILAGDVRSFHERLEAIKVKHFDRDGSSKDGDDLMKSIQIHEEYVEWCLSYDSVVLPTMESIVELFASAGADVSAINIRSATAAPTETGQA